MCPSSRGASETEVAELLSEVAITEKTVLEALAKEQTMLGA